MFRLTYLLYMGLNCFAVVSTDAISAEFCYRESFSPACQEHEMVEIHSARFGRLMPNRCGTGDPNGCTIDVKPDLDKVCAGSQSCNVPVHFNSFSGPDPCPNAAPDSYPWLEVTYECVTAHLTEDFCGDEIFSHSCLDNEVLLFRTANYGRMQLSRCASGDNLGCGEDVLSDMDRLCSGHQTCNFPVDQDTFTGSNHCPIVDPDTKLFLEVDYECAKVIVPSADFNCKRDMGIIVKNPDGYLSSYVAQKYNYGTLDCPWRIEVPQGYLLNITLFDFSTPVIANLEDEPPAGCHMYAVLTENHPTARKVYICRGDERIKNVYLSKTNNVKIGLKSGGGLSAVNGDNYLLKLDAVKVR